MKKLAVFVLALCSLGFSPAQAESGKPNNLTALVNKKTHAMLEQGLSCPALKAQLAKRIKKLASSPKFSRAAKTRQLSYAKALRKLCMTGNLGLASAPAGIFDLTSPTELVASGESAPIDVELLGNGFTSSGMLVLASSSAFNESLFSLKFTFISTQQLRLNIPASLLLPGSQLVLRAIKVGKQGVLLKKTNPLTVLVEVTSGVAGPPPASSKSLCLNLEELTDYSTGFPFVNLMKLSKDWVHSCESWTNPSAACPNPDYDPLIPGSLPLLWSIWDTKQSLSLDANGYPTFLLPFRQASTIIFSDVQASQRPRGKFELFWDGQGSVTVPGSTILSSAPGKLIFIAPDTDSGISVRITAVTPGNHVRNMRLFHTENGIGACASNPAQYCSTSITCPSGEACIPFSQSYETRPFHPLFLDAIEIAKTLRFMDWQRTNNSLEYDWSKRILPSYVRYTTTKGVPLELLVKLANDTNVNPWFNIPHLANNQYVLEFAKYIKQYLSPNLKASFEFSNEVWNSIFEQTTWAKNQGLAIGLSSDPLQATLKFYAKRATEVHGLISQTFGQSEISRVRRIVAMQAANPWTTDVVLSYIAQQIAPPSTVIDAVAIAPYFGGSYVTTESLPSVLMKTPAQILGEIGSTELPLIANLVATTRQKSLAAGLELIAYEGGQHFVGVGGIQNNSLLTKLLLDTNRSPLMAPLYRDYLNTWKNAGGGLFCLYSSTSNFKPHKGGSQFGHWGLLEYSGQQATLPTLATAPKYLGMLAWLLEQTP